MIEKAYAKINLSLDCIKKREDGYHDLESVVVPIELHDTLEISILPPTTPDDFVVCDQYLVKISKYNLVHQTIDLCREKFGFKDHLNIKIHKNIYVQAGLGGGSADAAACLRGIIKLYKLNPKKEEIEEICNKIGSDVLFQYYNHSAIMKGRGEIIENFDHNFNYSVLLVKPPKGNSTEEVYKLTDTLELPHGDTSEVLRCVQNNDLEGLGNATFNSLFLPATKLLPEIEVTYRTLLTFDFEVVQMSGSGSCLYAISKNKRALKKAARYFDSKGLQVDITKILPNK